MLLRSLVHELGKDASKDPGGYGGLKMERKRLGDILKENIDDPRLSDWDRDMIRGLWTKVNSLLRYWMPLLWPMYRIWHNETFGIHKPNVNPA